jgi:hypothetical protein
VEEVIKVMMNNMLHKTALGENGTKPPNSGSKTKQKPGNQA